MVKENITGWLFISPFVIGFIIFTARPLIRSIYYSFNLYDFLAPPTWVGLGNYRILVEDPDTWYWLLWTTGFAVFSVPTGLVLGLAIALIANTSFRGIAAIRT